MKTCNFCGQDFQDLIVCPKCEQEYCKTHINTSDHDCPLIPIKNPYEPNVETPADESFHFYENKNLDESDTYVYTDGTYVWYKKSKDVPEDAFNPDSGVVIPGVLWPAKTEFFHFLIASILLFTMSASQFYDLFINSGANLIETVTATIFLSSMYLITFLIHEFGHRQVAKHFGMQTKFRLFKWGVIMTAICIFLPIKFALPGAVVVIGLENISRETGLCKLAGPLTNLVFGLILLALALIQIIPDPFNSWILTSASFNFMLGAFNMLPFGILDGDNIKKWNPKVWLIMFVGLISLYILNVVLMMNFS